MNLKDEINTKKTELKELKNKLKAEKQADKEAKKTAYLADNVYLSKVAKVVADVKKIAFEYRKLGRSKKLAYNFKDKVANALLNIPDKASNWKGPEKVVGGKK
jgi:hypothetical protein